MPLFDPDLDVATHAPRGSYDTAVHQRMVVNPLLAVVALLGAWALFRYSLSVRNLNLFLATLFAAVVSLLLIQYHCLDCGRTDFVARSRQHACAAVFHRLRVHAEPPTFPPLVRTQVKAWCLAAVAALVIYGIFHNAH